MLTDREVYNALFSLINSEIASENCNKKMQQVNGVHTLKETVCHKHDFEGVKQ